MTKKLYKGCIAVGEAAVRAGCRFYAGYPITPQSAIPEYLSARLPQVGGTFIQGESEVASINMVYGASAAGARAMTSSSGLGISLMAEGLSYIAGAMLPMVLVNVVRGGPGLGSIQPAQQDYFQATRALGHGGFRNIVLTPATVQETIDMVFQAFDLADRDRNPVVVLMDGCLGQVNEEAEMPEMKEVRPRPSYCIGDFEEGLRPPRMVTSIPGEENLEKINMRSAMLFAGWEKNDVQVEEYQVDDAEIVIVAYGTSARVCKYAVNELRADGIKIGLIRPKTVVPFPKASIRNLDYSRVKAIIDVEMAIPAQMYDDISQQVMGRAPILTYGRSGGNVLMNEGTTEAIRKLVGGISK